jgi:ABC-type transport system involved in multi-copper enzyme maturation permease subunit
MDATAAAKPMKRKRWLPYWAVLQMDMRQMVRSWVFRVWFLTSVILSVGYLLHRAAIYQTGIIERATNYIAELLQFSLLVGSTLVVILTAGTISSERGTIADSVLSRGISRFQYFMGKWHARLIVILGSFLVLGGAILVASCFLLRNDDVSWAGSGMALLLVAAVLTVVISLGVTMSSMCQSTVLSIAILWMVLYGVGAGLYLVNFGQLNPARLLRIMPALLRGQFDMVAQATLIAWCMLASVLFAFVGMVYFSRCDV